MKMQGWGLLVMAGVLLSCRAKSEASAAVAGSVTAAPLARAGAPATSDARAALERIDTRTPLPLLPMMAHHQKQNMRDHLAAVQEIIAGVATKDFGAIEKAAARIGFSESMGQMCSHLGAGAPGFTDAALRFHHVADRIGEAARGRDADAVLTSLGETLNHCTGCHAQYKQRVVDEREWSATAGAEQGAPAHPSQHQAN